MSHDCSDILVQGSERKNKLYLICLFYAAPNFTPVAFTPALTPPVPTFALPPLRATFYATQSVRKETIDNGYF